VSGMLMQSMLSPVTNLLAPGLSNLRIPMWMGDFIKFFSLKTSQLSFTSWLALEEDVVSRLSLNSDQFANVGLMTQLGQVRFNKSSKKMRQNLSQWCTYTPCYWFVRLN
jgi:hypothetical protein